jgi:hypothetical protein
MNRSYRKPKRADAVEIVRIACLIADEAVKLILILRGGR